jgi:hypothetical protein
VELPAKHAEIFEIFRSKMCFIVKQTKCVTTLQQMATLCPPLCKRIRLYLQHLKNANETRIAGFKNSKQECKAAFPPTAKL